MQSTAPLSRLKICGNCTHAPFQLTTEEHQLLKDLAERNGIRAMRAWTQPHGPTFTLRRFGDAERQHALRIVLTKQAHCSTAKTRVSWPDVACYRWQKHDFCISAEITDPPRTSQASFLDAHRQIIKTNRQTRQGD